MKLKILHFSLLFAATTAKNVYFEDAATDSPGAAAVVPAAKLGVNESANYVYFEDAAADSPGAEAVVPAAKLNGVNVINETLAADHRRMANTNRVPTRSATLSGSTYAACEGTYVESTDMLSGKSIWDNYAKTRFIYYCEDEVQGRWVITGSQWRAAFLRGEITHCRGFIHSAPAPRQQLSGRPSSWWMADWSANNGAYVKDICYNNGACANNRA